MNTLSRLALYVALVYLAFAGLYWISTRKL